MSGEYVPERGYYPGGHLPFNEDPWPLGWEQNPNLDACPHLGWEMVVVHKYASDPETVVRCLNCHVPRSRGIYRPTTCKTCRADMYTDTAWNNGQLVHLDDQCADCRDGMLL